MRLLYYALFPAILILILFIPIDINYVEFQEFRIVLDPGHGGLSLKPRELHGDRFDLLSGKYLDDYKEGASFRRLKEHQIVFRIAEKTRAILDLCREDKFHKFHRILRRYSANNLKRIDIATFLSRVDSGNPDRIKSRKDPNSEFRLYDFPDKDGSIIHGRISHINSLKPHLVVSLHTGWYPPRVYRGLNPVIAAPYALLSRGMNYLVSKTDRKFFFKSPYSDWFSESARRSDFYWFLKDVSVYFTGYPITRQRELDNERFKGYRYNMITWAYKDDPGWEKTAREHPDNTQFSQSYKTFTAQGKFWEREQSIYEKYRREKGRDGYGGDNLYASNEIIRYILLSMRLHMKGKAHPDQILTKPYISIWTVPLHINAISAFIELGYLGRRRHRYLLTKKQNEIAEGIAVGIYSLLAGIQLKPFRFKQIPKGKRIDLKRYNITNKKTYFDIVVP